MSLSKLRELVMDGGLACCSPLGHKESDTTKWLNWCPLSQWWYLTISSSATSFFFCFQSFSATGSFPMSQLFASGGQSTRASASVLPVKIQGWFPLRLLVWSPCCSRDSQESSPAPQFNSNTSFVLSLLDGPTLTSICDYWKKHSFAYVDVSQQSGVSVF